MRNIQAVPPMDDVFAKSFSEWIINRPNKPTGFLPVPARDHGVSVGQLLNVLSERRKADEGWRQLVALKIGLPHETMFGLPPQFNTSTDPNLIVQVNSRTGKDRLNNISKYRGIPLYESDRLATGANGLVFDPYEDSASIVIVFKPKLPGRAKT